MDSYDDNLKDIFYNAVADRTKLLPDDLIDTYLLPYALLTL